jgi:WD40 repeat protein
MLSDFGRLPSIILIFFALALAPAHAQEPDRTKAEIIPQFGHSAEVSSVAYPPNGKVALSASFDGTLKLWDLATGRGSRALEGHSDLVTSVVFSSDGRSALSGSDDKTIKLWDVGTGREIRTFRGHSAKVNAVALSPDYKTVLSASADKTVKLWNMATAGAWLNPEW